MMIISMKKASNKDFMKITTRRTTSHICKPSLLIEKKKTQKADEFHMAASFMNMECQDLDLSRMIMRSTTSWVISTALEHTKTYAGELSLSLLIWNEE